MFCSIIIPLYNKADFITAAIQSVLTQSHQNFEVIIVDDGSTDDGALRVRAIPDHRIKLIQQVNSGVSCARNQGIELAKGDLVCFLDADDWYLSLYLETVVSMALNYPEIAFFATYYKCISNPNQTDMSWDTGDTRNVELIDNFFYRWRLSPIFVTNSVAIRRTDLSQFKPYFPLGEQWAEDQDLWFRLAEKSRLAYCPAPLVGYRKEVNGSLCSIYKPCLLMAPAYSRLEQRALDQQFPNNHRNSALRLVAEFKISLARSILMDGHRYDAFIQLLNAWRGMPSIRWWVSLIMFLTSSPAAVSRWENWRHQRAQKY